MDINNLSFEDSINAEIEDGISEPSPVNKNGPCFIADLAGDLDDVQVGPSASPVRSVLVWLAIVEIVVLLTVMPPGHVDFFYSNGPVTNFPIR